MRARLGGVQHNQGQCRLQQTTGMDGYSSLQHGYGMLMELRGIKVGLARALAAAGFDKLSTISHATAAELVAQVKHMTLGTAENVIGVAKESLRQRAEEVLLGLV